MGGLLAPELTSGTKLTPNVVSQANKVYLQAISDWNKSLSSQGLEPVQPIKAVGSTSYFEQDSTEQPDEIERVYGTSDVVYGDVDYLVQFPFPSNFSGDETERRREENKVKREYGQLMQDFFDSPSSPKEVKAVTQPMVVVELPSGEHVQVDAIVTFPKYSNWMKSRYSSERGLKGYITGNLYAALGDALVLTVGTEGVLARTRNGERVTSRIRKDVIINSVSIDPQNFLMDIAGYIIGSDDFEASPMLQRHSGWDEDAVRISDIGKGIVGLASTLEANMDGFSKKELLNSVLSTFEAKLGGTIDKKRKMMTKKGFDGEDKLSKLEKQNEKSLNLMSSIFNTELSLGEQYLRSLIREVKSSLSEDLRIDKNTQADIIKKAIGDPNYLIHFSDLNKLGINPKTKYNTPAGIYGWIFTKDIIEDAKKNRIFASARKYGHLMKVRDGAKVLWLGDDARNDDLPSLTQLADILASAYPALNEPYEDLGMSVIEYLRDNWRIYSKTSSREDGGKTNSEDVYNFIMATSSVLVQYMSTGGLGVIKGEKKITSIANKLLRSAGYDAIIDVNCAGIIHKAEACQGFFTHSGGLEHVAVIENNLWKTGGAHLPVLSILSSPTATSELLMKALAALTSPSMAGRDLGANQLSFDDALEGILKSLEIDKTRKAFTWEILQHILQFIEDKPDFNEILTDVIRAEILSHPSTDIGYIVDLISDSISPGKQEHLSSEQMSVLLDVIQNENLPSNILSGIYHTDYLISYKFKYLIEKRIIRHPNCPIDILESAIDDIAAGKQNPIAVDAAYNPNAPEEKLIDIIFDNRGMLKSSTEAEWMNTKNIMGSPAFSDDITLEIIRQLPDVEQLKGQSGGYVLADKYWGILKDRKKNISTVLVLAMIEQMFEHILEYGQGADKISTFMMNYFKDLRESGKRLSIEEYNKFNTYVYGLENAYKDSPSGWGSLPIEKLRSELKEIEPKRMNETLDIENLRKIIREVKNTNN